MDHTLHLPSNPAERSKCPVPGNSRILCTPLVSDEEKMNREKEETQNREGERERGREGERERGGEGEEHV